MRFCNAANNMFSKYPELLKETREHFREAFLSAMHLLTVNSKSNGVKDFNFFPCATIKDFFEVDETTDLTSLTKHTAAETKLPKVCEIEDCVVENLVQNYLLKFPIWDVPEVDVNPNDECEYIGIKPGLILVEEDAMHKAFAIDVDKDDVKIEKWGGGVKTVLNTIYPIWTHCVKVFNVAEQKKVWQTVVCTNPFQHHGQGRAEC